MSQCSASDSWSYPHPQSEVVDTLAASWGLARMRVAMPPAVKTPLAHGVRLLDRARTRAVVRPRLAALKIVIGHEVSGILPHSLLVIGKTPCVQRRRPCRDHLGAVPANLCHQLLLSLWDGTPRSVVRGWRCTLRASGRPYRPVQLRAARGVYRLQWRRGWSAALWSDQKSGWN